jgi:hypothetical protein
MTTIDLTDKQLEETRRAIIKSAVADMEGAAEQMAQLAAVAPWPNGTESSDAQNAVANVRESLDILDALGWPRDETREEFAARKKAKAEREANAKAKRGAA